MVPGSRRPTPTLWKLSGKFSTGISKDAKSSVSPSSSIVGDKTQAMIMGFWKGGSQEDNFLHVVPPQVDTQLTLNRKTGADSERKMHPDDASKEKDSLLNWLQTPEALDAPEIELPEGGFEATVAKEKRPEWPKDGGVTFYSLTEDSDSTNSDQGSSETGASISSESMSFLSLAESTVRQRQ
ncbi:hypothetical protein NDU88_003118 [Pleurodeles waltl]|uniref:Uncharacterized protein n=1 Tax=Pleurodeles waltl TaxID=8319 RepID=A0AAV7KW24_PLEWA|nr:hypothetical protein NDU88_003118 [Pleurodeles waltl]